MAPNRIRNIDNGIAIANTNHHRIVKYQYKGDELEKTFSFPADQHPKAQLRRVWPIDFVFADHRWWVLNADDLLKNADLLTFDQEGKPLNRIGLPQGADPVTIEADQQFIWLTDYDNSRVYQINFDGHVTSFGDSVFITLLEQNRTKQETWQGRLDWSQKLLLSFCVIGIIGGFMLQKKYPEAAKLSCFNKAKSKTFMDDTGVTWLEPATKAFKWKWFPYYLSRLTFILGIIITKVSEFKKQNKSLINKDKYALKEYNIG